MSDELLVDDAINRAPTGAYGVYWTRATVQYPFYRVCLRKVVFATKMAMTLLNCHKVVGIFRPTAIVKTIIPQPVALSPPNFVGRFARPRHGIPKSIGRVAVGIPE